MLLTPVALYVGKSETAHLAIAVYRPHLSSRLVLSCELPRQPRVGSLRTLFSRETIGPA